MLRILSAVALLVGAQSSSIDVQKNITAQGYPAETHHVTTSDGYILELHRIPHGKGGKSSNRNQKVVFLMHSILAASNSFIYAGPKNGIAFNFADAGFDVWMGNARGNRYSRRHTSLDPDKDKKEFFDFDYEEIGRYDLSAMMDYILETTKRNKLHYVGHTQGGAVFFVQNSMKNTYHSKIASAHLLAGIGYEKYFPNSLIKAFSSIIDLFYDALLLTGTVELFPSPITTALLGAFVNMSVPNELVGGASTKQVIHFGQNFRDQSFRRWNYGPVNFIKYGNIVNPEYDLSKININVTMYYARDDKLQGTQDVLDMVRDLPNARARRIARDDFTHLDYLVSDDVKELVTVHIIEAINNS